MNLIYNTFQSGELAPQMKGRSDLPQYHQGCEECDGFVVLPTGGVTRAPGTEHIYAGYSASYPSRLVEFVNGTDRYMLEFNDQVMRVFKDGDIVLDGDDPYELATPWTYDELADLVFTPGKQAIFHPDHDIYELTCDGDTSWTLTAFDSSYGPFLDENETTTKTLTPSATTGTITITATGHTPFVTGDSGHVGGLVAITHEVDESVTTDTVYDDAQTAEITINGTWELKLTGRFAADVKWERSEDDGVSWKIVRRYHRTTPSKDVIRDEGVETEFNVKYRLTITWIGEPDPPDGVLERLFNTYDYCTYTIKAQYAWQTGIARITAVTSTSLVSATVLNAFGGTGASHRWKLGSWNPYQGYPACGMVHESRVYAARSARQPRTVWAGKPFLRRANARIFDHGTTVEADDALTRTIDLPDFNVIQWMASLWVALIGSDASLVKGIGAGENNPITAEHFYTLPQSGMGSSSLQPVKIAGFLAYSSRDSKRVYEMTYSDDARIYQPEDLTFFADHIAGSGISGWCFQQQPYPILWCWTNDGEIIGLTRDREKGVMAWFTRSMVDATVESMAILPGDTYDEVWLSVSRTVNGSTYRSIERMAPFDWGSSQRDCWFVDSGTKWDGGSAVTVTGIIVNASTGRVTVTAASHGFSDGYTVKFASVAGMTDVNGKVYTVADADTNTFVLKTRDGSAYIDGSSFSSYTSGGTVERVAASVTGLTQLAGASVVALLDGQPATGTVTTAGVYTIGTKDRHYHNTIIVGRDYTYTLKPMKPEVRTVQGSLQGRKMKVGSVGVRLYKSAGGQIGSTTTDAQDIDYDLPGRTVGDDVELASRDIYGNCPGGWSDDGSLVITGNGPFPMTISAIFFELEAG